MVRRFFSTLSIIFTCLPGISSAGLIGYWQNFDNPAQTPVRLTDIPPAYSIVTIAFADLAADGSASFTLQGPPYTTMSDGENTFKKDIQTLRAKGVKVLLSLGGQNGFYQINTADQEQKFASSLENIISTYGFDGLDYDLENGLSAANASFLVNATQNIKQDFQAQGKSLYFTAAPETMDVYWMESPNGKYDALIKAGLLDLVQVQLYNSGCMPDDESNSPCFAEGNEDFIVSQADSTIQTWMKQGVSDAAAKYVIGLPASANAAGGGYVDPAVAKKAMTCLQTQTQCGSYQPMQAYPELTNVMTWSINWDAKNGYAFAKVMAN